MMLMVLITLAALIAMAHALPWDMTLWRTTGYLDGITYTLHEVHLFVVIASLVATPKSPVKIVSTGRLVAANAPLFFPLIIIFSFTWSQRLGE